MSFFFIIASRESTHRFSATFPCLIPIPYGASRKMSSVSFAVGSVARLEASDGVVEHDRVRPALVEGEHRVRDAVRHDRIWVLEKQRLIQRS